MHSLLSRPHSHEEDACSHYHRFRTETGVAPLGGKIVGQTSTTVLGLALQRTFTLRFRLVP